MAKIYCKAIAEDIKKEIINEAKTFERSPRLATILVGDRADSQTYVRNKEKTLINVGFDYKTYRFPSDVSQEDLESKLLELRVDNSIDGILIQLPLPDHLDTDKLISMIPYYKDVDGLTEKNQAMLMTGKNWDDFIQPCTPLGIVKILEEQYFFSSELDGMNVAVVGRSNLLGNPLAQMLMRKNMNVLHLHSKSFSGNMYSMKKMIGDFNPDIICLCTGQKNLLKSYHIINSILDSTSVKTIIDAGIIRDENGLRGDFKKEDYEDLDELGVYYTTVPGGVGVLTTTMLAYNLAKCFKLHMKNIPDL